MTTFNVKNFAKSNTPPLIEKIGNWSLIACMLGGAIALMPVATVGVTVINAGLIISAIGGFGKGVAKLFGTKPAIPTGEQ